MRAWAVPRCVLSFAIAMLSALSGCGSVKVRPESALPKALIAQLPAHVGLVLGAELRNYTHKETRWGADWEIALGPGHVHLFQDVFNSAFAQVEQFRDLDSARGASGLKALFEPRIEQYSFVTARETGGRYYAVTIRYRIVLHAPSGEQVDALTLTGYGNALTRSMAGSGTPLERATLRAMRDAAAKFLAQFPEQPAGQQLARNEELSVQQQLAATGADAIIEAVPIDDPAPATDGAPASSSPAN